jgi:hypothetical protein
MLKAIFKTLRFIILILAGHKQIALENAALRQPLPTHHSSGLYNDKRCSPLFPDLHQDDPEQPIVMSKLRPRLCPFEDRQLLAIQAVLEQAVPEEGTRASAGLYRTPQVGSNNGVG